MYLVISEKNLSCTMCLRIFLNINIIEMSPDREGRILANLNLSSFENGRKEILEVTLISFLNLS